MTVQPRARAVDLLRRDLTGQVLLPADAGYESARRIWNAAITTQPALVVQVADELDVARTVRWAAAEGLQVALRGGGHNIAGTALLEGGVTVDMRGLTEVAVDPPSRRVSAGAGLTWEALDHATQAHGLATPGGVVPATGIAGLTLGGGYGWLSRAYGWTCDNLVGARLVAADGSTVAAGESEDPELLWALRGGGGNLAAVTSMTFRLHVVPDVFRSVAIVSLERAREAVAECREILADASDGLGMVLGFVPRPQSAPGTGGHVLRVGICDLGPHEGAAAADRVAARVPVLHEVRGRVPYETLQALLAAGGELGLGHYSKSRFLMELDDECVDRLVESTHRAGPRSRIVVHGLGGAIARPDALGAAFGHREAVVNLQIDATWVPGEEPGPHVAWARHLYAATAPWGSGGTYVNFLGGDEGEAGLRAAFAPEDLHRLQTVQLRLDPDNIFHQLTSDATSRKRSHDVH